MQMGCKGIRELSVAKCKAPLKDDIANWLHGALTFVDMQNGVIGNLLSTVGELQDQVIESQRTVIQLQEQLIASKDEQLQSMQNTVC